MQRAERISALCRSMAFCYGKNTVKSPIQHSFLCFLMVGVWACPRKVSLCRRCTIGSWGRMTWDTFSLFLSQNPNMLKPQKTYYTNGKRKEYFLIKFWQTKSKIMWKTIIHGNHIGLSQPCSLIENMVYSDHLLRFSYCTWDSYFSLQGPQKITLKLSWCKIAYYWGLKKMAQPQGPLPLLQRTRI